MSFVSVFNVEFYIFNKISIWFFDYRYEKYFIYSSCINEDISQFAFLQKTSVIKIKLL